MPLLPPFYPSILGFALLVASPGEIEELVPRLGSPRFAEREAATGRLQAIGERARDALQTAADKSNDAEARRRAARLLATLDTDSFQGRWESRDEGGPFLIVRGNSIIFHRGVATPCTFWLAPAQTPHAIDLVKMGRVVLTGIYAVKRDELELCLPIRENLNRPPAFAKAGDGDFVTFHFRRVPQP
jgi:uncharacterized protein (TIGR03067 family)